MKKEVDSGFKDVLRQTEEEQRKNAEEIERMKREMNEERRMK